MNDEALIEATEETTDNKVDTSISQEMVEAEQEGDLIENSEAHSQTQTPNEENAEKDISAEAMLAELRALREELLQKKKAFEKMSRDIGEFEELYPERKVNEIPDSVWESVKEGIPLAAAYALYERKNALRANTARNANEANSARATGSIGREVTENFYTPDEVRAMSRAEVRSNYSKILESMKKWN